jgi:hypothetical protein
MAATFTKIATVTVGSGGAAHIEFTSIPATYTDLYIALSIRSARADTDDQILIDFNSYAGTNLSYRNLVGNGASASSANGSTGIYVRIDAANNTASTFTSAYYYIPNYAGSNYKSLSVDSAFENNSTTAYLNMVAGLWSSTSAITSLKIYSANSENIAQYSTATLYGIKNS